MYCLDHAWQIVFAQHVSNPLELALSSTVFQALVGLSEPLVAFVSSCHSTIKHTSHHYLQVYEQQLKHWPKRVHLNELSPHDIF